MSILEKAYELGQEIAASAELQEMKNAEQSMMQDQEAQGIIQEFNAKQKKYLEMQRQGQQLTDDQKKEVADLEKRMLENSFVYSFFQAQQNFEKVLEEINNIISRAISGQASCSDECCTSCSGCGH